jgi:hypothetical protein
MRGAPAPVAGVLALLAAGLVALPACNMAVPALYVIQGPNKKPAQFTLPEDRKLVVFVDDRENVVSRLQLRAQIADDIGTVLQQQELVREVVSGRELIAYVRRVETASRRVPIDELGKVVGADLVLYVEMDSFALSADGASATPVSTGYLKVIDLREKRRLFPPDGDDPRGFPVTSEVKNMDLEMYRTSAARRKAEDLLAKTFAQDVARVFFEHDPKNFGGGVSEFRR